MNAGKNQNQGNSSSGAAGAHSDENCPKTEQILKLKGEIKRLRQELILKGPSKRKQNNDYDSEDESQGEAILDDEVPDKTSIRFPSQAIKATERRGGISPGTRCGASPQQE